jgi:hypothetical protein
VSTAEAIHASRQSSSRVTPREAAVAVVCIALAVAPFVVPAIPVGTDLPKHAFVAQVLSHYSDPQLKYAEHFRLVLRPRSTVLAEMALAGLMLLAAPFAAVKILMVLAAATLWTSTRFMVVQMGKPPIAALLTLPVLHTFPVFSGFLPYSVSVVMFPFLLGTLLKYPAGRVRALRVACLLALLYGIHIVAAAIGCLTVGIFALCELGTMEWLVRLLRQKRTTDIDRAGAIWDLLSMAPAVGLMVYFILQREGRSVHMTYFSPFRQVATYLAYNAVGLSKAGGYAFLAGVLLLAVAAFFGVRRRHTDIRLLMLSAGVFFLGLLLPVQVGDWFVVGSRTFPFALFAAIGLLDLSQAQWRSAAAVGVSVLTITSALNTTVAVRVQPLYNVFLSGLNSVEYGSRILPIIEDSALGGNVFVQPFDGIADAYNIFRGGSNAYVLAYPVLLTGASPIEMKWKPEFDYKFDAGEKHPNYQGVSRVYDYVLVFGNMPETIRQLESEMRLQFHNGPLRIYRGNSQWKSR